MKKYICLLLVFGGCKKDEPSPVDKILGDYEKGVDMCSSNGSLGLLSWSFTIKKMDKASNAFELVFQDNFQETWQGIFIEDTLYFSKQTPIINTKLPPNTFYKEISGFGILKGSTIYFQIEEIFCGNACKQTCTFLAKRK